MSLKYNNFKAHIGIYSVPLRSVSSATHTLQNTETIFLKLAAGGPGQSIIKVC